MKVVVVSEELGQQEFVLSDDVGAVDSQVVCFFEHVGQRCAQVLELGRQFHNKHSFTVSVEP